MGSTVGSRMETGKVTGTGAEIKVSLPDFTPRKVVLRNVASGDELAFVDTMNAGEGFKRVAAGTGALITTGGVTLVYQDVLSPPVGGTPQDPGRGFLIGTDADINAVGEEIQWEAHE